MEEMDQEDRERETPTPSQYASRNMRYASNTSMLSASENVSREWARSPDMSQFARNRASPAPSEPMSRQPRLYRVGGHDALKEARRVDSEQITVASMSGAPAPEVKKSDPETESVESLGAPSTVWDELDDLKSRIRKLELTGKLPPSSGAAIAYQSTERPRTATTAPTTISSSPKHVRKQSVAPSDTVIGGPAAANVHPLLHNALAKSRSLLNPTLYRALEVTAADALALAAMTGNTGPQGTTYSAASFVNGVTVSDRHIRRKADNMCRNLTDLCIALCEGKHDLASPSIKASPAGVSRLQADTPPSRYARRSSIEPDDRMLRSSPSRTMSRLDNRRSSLLGLGLNNPPNQSPRETSDQYPQTDSSPSQNQTDYAARYSRPGTSLMRNRYSQFDEEEREDPTIRAPSRAMTDIGHRHVRSLSTRRTDVSEGLQPRSPSLRDTLAARRSGGIPEEGMDEQIHSPSVAQNGARRFLERHAALQSEAGSVSADKRRRRITSLEQYSSSPRSEGGPMRTSSLSRQRNVVVE